MIVKKAIANAIRYCTKRVFDMVAKPKKIKRSRPIIFHIKKYTINERRRILNGEDIESEDSAVKRMIEFAEELDEEEQEPDEE